MQIQITMVGGPLRKTVALSKVREILQLTEAQFAPISRALHAIGKANVTYANGMTIECVRV